MGVLPFFWFYRNDKRGVSKKVTIPVEFFRGLKFRLAYTITEIASNTRTQVSMRFD